MKRLLYCLFFSFLLLNGQAIFAQDKVEIRQAAELTYDKLSGIPARRLIGNVILAQKDVLLYCDSAWLFESTNRAECYGFVRITQGEKFSGTCGFLSYDGNTRQAIMDSNVNLVDGETTLTTNRLDYNTATKIGYYTTGAVIKRPDGTLTSVKGTYNSPLKTFFFREKVTIDNSELALRSDSLNYQTDIRRADLLSFTTIVTPDSRIKTERGWYNTKSKDMYLYQNTEVLFDSVQFIRADTLFYQKEADKGYGKCFVHVYDSVQKLAVWADDIRFNRKTGRILASQAPYMAFPGEEDTLWLQADTLWREKSVTDSSTLLKAWNKVNGMQEKLIFACDSLVYIEKDSVFRFYTAPIIFSDEYQITGKFMELFSKNKALDRLLVHEDAFLLKTEDSLRHSQVKGREAIARIENKKMKNILMEGNAESIYWLKDEQKKYIGANTLQCAEILVEMKDGQADQLHFFKKPDGKLIPFKKTDPETLKLKGMSVETKRKTSALKQFDQVEEWLKKPTKSELKGPNLPKKLKQEAGPSKSKKNKKTATPAVNK